MRRDSPTPTNGLTFPDLNSGVDPNNGATGAAVTEMFQTILIMPELKFLTAMALFIGRSNAAFTFMTNLATAADAAQRGNEPSGRSTDEAI
jgi:hypothetical protein